MATFGPIGSAAPNILFDPMMVDQALQRRDHNALMMQGAQQDQRFKAVELDNKARIALAQELAGSPDAEAQWAPRVRQLQAQGLGKNLNPDVFPGQEHLAHVATLDLNSFQKAQIEHHKSQIDVQREHYAQQAAHQEAALAQQAAHQKASLGLQGASLAETRRHHQALLAQQAGEGAVGLAPGSDPTAPRIMTDKHGVPVNRGLGEGQVWGVTPDGQRVAMPAPGFTAKTAGAPSTVSAGDRTKLRDIETNAAGIMDALNTYEQKRGQAGLMERGASALGASTDLNAAYSNTALLAKGDALYQLGVLNGGDLDIMRRTLADPSTVGGALASQDTVKAQADQIRTMLKSKIARAREQYGGAATAPNPMGGAPAGPEGEIRVDVTAPRPGGAAPSAHPPLPPGFKIIQ